MKLKSIKLLFLTLGFLVIPVFCLAEETFPVFPMAFWGSATLNDLPMSAGTTIRAYCSNSLIGEITMIESGVYGYNEATKNKLLVSNCDNDILFKYLLEGGNEDLTGGLEVKYTEGFISGTTINKDLNFINNRSCSTANGTGNQAWDGNNWGSCITATQTVPSESGFATINSTTPQVVITNPTQVVTVTISSGTTNPTIDVSSFISGGTGTIPQITIVSANAGNANVAIPASTTVTSADSAWDGVIAAPTVTTVTLPETSGQTKTLSTAIEVGFTGAKLSFDKAVRLLLPGQAGKRAGYVRTGITFTEITNICATDNQATGDALAIDGDCKISVGSDLIIWTKHFTKFATYTQTVISSSGSGSSGGGGGGGGDYTAPTISNINVAVSVKEATITWITNESSISWVVYGTSTSYGLEAKTTTYNTSHSLILSNLSPATPYHYSVKSKDSTGNVGSYTDKSFTTRKEGDRGSLSDINNDGKINKYDFSLMMANWGKTGSNNCDLNNDSKVDKYDFALLMLNWSI